MAENQKKIPVAEKWCHTQIELGKVNYTWTINNFNFCIQEKGESLKSSIFSAGIEEKSQWCVEMFPKGTDQESENYVSLYLTLVSSSRSEVTAKFDFSILNARKEKTKANGKPIMHGFSQGKDWGFKKFISRDLLLDETKGLLLNNELTICCELTIVEMVNIPSQGDAIQFKVPECTFSREYGLLLENQQFTDVTLFVENGEFKVHKTVLAARSPVFRAMFEHEMRESQQNEVYIPDMNYEVLEQMLQFIYTEETSKLEKMTHDLLAAANKYAFERLKVMCEKALCDTLSIDNATDTLILADLHNANNLKAHTINFINTYAIQVMNTPGWKEMMQTHPQLVMEAYRALAIKTNLSEVPKTM